MRLRHRPALGRADRPARGTGGLGGRRSGRAGADRWRARPGRPLRAAPHRGALGGRLLRRRRGSGWWTTPPGSRWRATCASSLASRCRRKCAPAASVRPVAAAWDGAGEEVTARVRRRDEVYASGYASSRYQGVAAKPWTFTFDLGEAPGAPVRLLLDGWIFPADASLNLALAQRPDLAPVFPRLEVETASGWQPLVPQMGFPAGKTKTMVDRYPAAPGRRAAAAHRHHPLARLGPGRLDCGASRRRRGGGRPPRSRDGRAALPRLLGAGAEGAERAARLRLQPHDSGVPLAALPRPLHALRRRAGAAGRGRRPLGNPRAWRRDRGDLRRLRPAAGAAGLEAHPVPGEPSAGTRTPTATPTRRSGWSRCRSAP